MTNEAMVGWREQTDRLRSAVGAAFSEVGDAGRYAAEHHGPNRYAQLQAASDRLVTALNNLTADPEPPDTVVATMLGGAVKHLRRATLLIRSIGESDDAEAVATAFGEAFQTGATLWRRMIDEILVLTGDAPVGEDF